MNRPCTSCDTFSRIVVLDFENRQALCYWCSVALFEGQSAWLVPQGSQKVQVEVCNLLEPVPESEKGKQQVELIPPVRKAVLAYA